MRKTLILLALAMLTISSTGCCKGRLRNLFRRGAPCGGTRLAAPAMLGGAIPLGLPAGLRQPVIPQGVVAQPGVCCEQSAPMCEPCPTECVPCDQGYIGGDSGYIGEGGDCGCPSNSGEYFGGYVGEGAAPVEYGGGGYEGTYEGNVVPDGTVIDGGTYQDGSGTYPGPTN